MKNKRTLFEANDHQYTALVKAKEYWGRNWKFRLRHSWETSNYPEELRPYKAELQQIRNYAGPTWLTNFRLEA